MGRAKIPRKSTNIDMTAMCDVAFLLLSFFILATKQKPPEAVAVATPNSVSSVAVPENSLLITLTKEGKCFLMLGEDTKKKQIIESVNSYNQLGLSDPQITRLASMPVLGMPLGQIKGLLDLGEEIPPSRMPGIPIGDSTNELTDWIRGINIAYTGIPLKELEDKILLKGDQQALYPTFKNIKQALKKNNIFKFRIVTNGEIAPVGSELYNNNKLGVTATGEKKK
ncbi:biopolymer transporter ExbD [Ferruginibacter sp. SUN002]|uniref:biopolymer transporter ExbD n=1 Tax=Ferruginibacter sp. SUN002 TaxID=2937789 RepID=UPI003D35D21F